MAKRVVLELGFSTNFVYSLRESCWENPNSFPVFCCIPDRTFRTNPGI